MTEAPTKTVNDALSDALKRGSSDCTTRAIAPGIKKGQLDAIKDRSSSSAEQFYSLAF